MNCCSELNDHYEGITVKGIPYLYSRLEAVDTDYNNWVTTFKCSQCGQIWVEKYTSKGHGEVPEVFKKSPLSA